MPAQVNRRWLLKSRPSGMVDPSHFDWSEDEVPQPADGEFLVRNLYLSLDPAMRTWMTAVRSYIPPVEIGEVMRGACVGEIDEKVATRGHDYGVTLAK